MNKCDGIKILELDPKSSIDDIEQSITSINNKITNIENNLGNVGELL